MRYKLEQKTQKKGKNEINLPFSKRMRNLRSLRQLYEILQKLKEFNSDEDNILYYVVEQNERGMDVYSLMIAKRFAWSDQRVCRLLKRLEKNKLIIKIDKCPHCGKKYKRIPEVCKNPDCSEILIRQQGLNSNKLKFPHFIVRLTGKGINYVNSRLTNIHVIMRILNIRIDNLRKRNLYTQKDGLE